MSEKTILIGTNKGAFVLRRKAGEWSVSGPHCEGWPINHVISSGERLWAAGGSEWFGAGVWRSGNGGESWTLAKLSDGQMDEWARGDAELAGYIGYVDVGPAPFASDLKSIWSLGRAGNRLLAGGNPAALYASDDDGESWVEISGLTGHPSREEWIPGAAGLVLHSIVTDPADAARLWVAISAAGVFASEDGGESWERRNRVSNEEGAAGHAHTHPAAGDGHETGHCVHNLVRAPGEAGDLMWQQNHHGVYRSNDGGRSWSDVSEGLPSRFGFPVAVHPHDPDTAWVLPLNGDVEGRFPPDASAAVWKTQDAGRSWQRKGAGLPQSGCFFTVLRQGMTVSDTGTGGAVLAFGTNSGSVFLSEDEGESWQEIARHLPLVLSVEMG
ncbi:MAG: exo-alpha-sialidase [Pararhodobacter sp.]|nr:exo-alpha-sialidase [Pararhodobacter sp.]